MLSHSAPPEASPQSVIELALQGLQQERTACVARLGIMLASKGNDPEIQAYLQRIAHINAALVRLASSHIIH